MDLSPSTNDPRKSLCLWIAGSGGSRYIRKKTSFLILCPFMFICELMISKNKKTVTKSSLHCLATQGIFCMALVQFIIRLYDKSLVSIDTRSTEAQQQVRELSQRVPGVP